MNTPNARTPVALALPTLLLAIAAGCSSGGDDGPSTGPTGPGTSGDTRVVIGQIDRMGRPGVSTALIRTDDDEDAYNANGDPNTWDAAFRAPMLERVRLIDGLDEVPNNLVTGSADSLTTLLIDDRLQIDTSIAMCDAYLALEIGLGGCGGRTLERDVIDDTLRHLITGDPEDTNPLISDLANANDADLPSQWPFLAEPFASTDN